MKARNYWWIEDGAVVPQPVVPVPGGPRSARAVNAASWFDRMRNQIESMPSFLEQEKRNTNHEKR